MNEFKDDVFTTPKAKEYIDIASGFHKLFKNDAKIAESLKPATTKNLSQGLATTLSGALKYQWTKFTLGTLYRNAPDRILGVKLPKALNEATAGAALKYHIKRALERSHSISEFSKNLELSAQKSHFSNNTLKIIEELNNGVKQAGEEIKEKATKYEKALKELKKIDESKLTKEQKQVLKVFKGELDQAEIKGIDLNDLYILEQGSRNAGARKILRKQNGAESTGALTNEELINMSEVIKNGSVLLESFERLKNGFRYGYEWDNNGVKLRLVVDDLNDGNKIFDFYRNFKDFRDASLHSGNHPYEPNPTPKSLNSQEDLLNTSENLNETTPKPTHLSPLEQANAEKLAKLQREQEQSEQEFLKAKEQELKRKDALKRKLEHGARLGLHNKWVVSSYELYDTEKQALRSTPQAITKEKAFNSLNSVEPNPTTNTIKTQEPLSEQANAKKLLKLETEKASKAEALKKLDFDGIKKLIDESPNNGKDIIVIGDNNLNLTPEIVEYIHRKHAKVGIERLDEDEITAFNFTYPKNAKAIIDYQGIQHALNKHGINSPSVKFSKQPPITYKDIANYRDIVKNADETIKRDNRIISYKQVNGNFVVVEQINRNKSEFIFKTMFKEKGEYKNAPDYKKNIKEND